MRCSFLPDCKNIKKFIIWFACAFERCQTGASSRKFTMFFFTLCAGFLHIIVGKVFINGTIQETQAIIWVILGMTIIDCVTILLIMNILKAHDLSNIISASKNEKNNNDPGVSPDSPDSM